LSLASGVDLMKLLIPAVAIGQELDTTRPEFRKLEKIIAEQHGMQEVQGEMVGDIDSEILVEMRQLVFHFQETQVDAASKAANEQQQYERAQENFVHGPRL
jgi:hypothetical protein